MIARREEKRRGAGEENKDWGSGNPRSSLTARKRKSSAVVQFIVYIGSRHELSPNVEIEVEVEVDIEIRFVITERV